MKVEAAGLAANEAYRARGVLMVARGAARGIVRSSIFFLLYCFPVLLQTRGSWNQVSPDVNDTVRHLSYPTKMD